MPIDHTTVGARPKPASWFLQNRHILSYGKRLGNPICGKVIKKNILNTDFEVRMPDHGRNVEPAVDGGVGFQWTVGNIFLSLVLFLLAGLAEIGGGWLVWQTIREKKEWYLALIGSLVLVGYGFIPCAQPVDNFGRVYAVYGGFFILLSYLWGWVVDKQPPDAGDLLGTAIAMTGVLVAFFWPR
jgi:drug/metabolite transporter superfamily protein YnfA